LGKLFVVVVWVGMVEDVTVTAAAELEERLRAILFPAFGIIQFDVQTVF
jgi:hypothetical protein